MTFIGNRAPAAAVKPIIAAAVGNSLLSFGVGTVSAASVFILAYLTQLHYGNASASAPWWHYVTYVLVVAAVAGFIIGICFARTAVIASLYASAVRPSTGRLQKPERESDAGIRVCSS